MATSKMSWEEAPAEVKLADDAVHLWRTPLTASDAELTYLEHTLAPDEVARAMRFRFEGDRRRFITSRGRLRLLLGRYLDIAPDQLTFCYGLQGKPALALGAASTNLQFNVSHAHNLALFAVTTNRQIGVDIERLRTVPESDLIAQSLFSRWEWEMLCAAEERERLTAFFRCWTRKEAFIKALGDGLAYPLDRFAVSVGAEETPQLLWVDGNHEETTRWLLRGLEPAPGYVAAVAVQGHDWELASWSCLPAEH